MNQQNNLGSKSPYFDDGNDVTITTGTIVRARCILMDLYEVDSEGNMKNLGNAFSIEEGVIFMILEVYPERFSPGIRTWNNLVVMRCVAVVRQEHHGGGNNVIEIDRSPRIVHIRIPEAVVYLRLETVSP